MNVMITGGSGFIGSHIVDKLKEKGHNVRIFDLVPSFRNDVEYYKGTLLSIDELKMCMDGVDVVFHLGAVADVADVFKEPVYSEKINVTGTINVLEAIRQTGVKRIIYASTEWVYSNAKEEVVDEEAIIPPPSHLYTSTKFVSELYCRNYSEMYGVPFTILRYGIPYGPRSRPAAVMPIFVQKALNGEPLTIKGTGEQFRQFIYVEDLAEGNVAGLNEIAKNKIYNIVGDKKITVNEVAETIKKILGNVEIIHIKEERVADFKGKIVKNDKAKKELGWTPRTSLEQGLRKYIEWVKTRSIKSK